jgi:hypothetical protein
MTSTRSAVNNNKGLFLREWVIVLFLLTFLLSLILLAFLD